MEHTTYPNQRQITIHKCDEPKGYSKIDVAANKLAMSSLNYSAYMLYMLLCMNATGFTMSLSKAAICNETSLTKNPYYAGFNTLVEAGYLVQRPRSKCLFDFYEDPSLACPCPEKGKTHTGKRESPSLKRAENIKIYRKTEARGGANALPSGEENNNERNIVNYNEHVFADI